MCLIINYSNSKSIVKIKDTVKSVFNFIVIVHCKQKYANDTHNTTLREMAHILNVFGSINSNYNLLSSFPKPICNIFGFKNYSS